MADRHRLACFLSRWIAASFCCGYCLGAPPTVTIYPSGTELPANHLKFYLHFPGSMRQGVFLDHCRLLDEDGHEVLEPFRETELWSPDEKRLTLWLHPGRQKTGVNLNVEFGPVLEPGRTYRLIISGNWPTAEGSLIGQDVVKTFRTLPPVHSQLNPGTWRLSCPSSGTREPLVVTFPAALDHALLHRFLTVRQSDRDVAGKATSDSGETVWRFVPQNPWQASAGQLIVNSLLEDLAGNSLARPFEIDLDSPPPAKVPDQVILGWQPKPLR